MFLSLSNFFKSIFQILCFQENLFDSFDFFIKVLVNKTPEQCRDHFERVYVENASGEFADDWNLGEENPGGARKLVTSFKFPVRCVK